MEKILLYCGVIYHKNGSTIFAVDEDEFIQNQKDLVNITIYKIREDCCNDIKDVFYFITAITKSNEERNKIFALILSIGFVQHRTTIVENPLLLENEATILNIEQISMVLRNPIIDSVMKVFAREKIENVFYKLQTIGGEMYSDLLFQEKRFLFN